MRWLRLYGPVLFLILTLIFYNEYFIFHFALSKCDWPCDRCSPQSLKAFMISDTHLLGKQRGHWLDKLKREWQMFLSFRIATWHHEPEVVFFLGDLLDEGQWAGRELFGQYADRFRELFDGDEQRVVALAGNHDLGFHYAIMPDTVESFRKEFRRGLVDEIRLKNQTFVLINSMAMHGDGCQLCHEAEQRLKEIGARLTDRPVVLQHFPLYRKSDKSCEKVDDYHEIDLKEQYREQWDTLSRESSQKIVKLLNPRAVFGGHTHKMCKRNWKLKNGGSFFEYTLNSFSWRNGDVPSIFLVVIDEHNVAVRSCRLPSEFTQIAVYVVGGICIFILTVFITVRNLCRTKTHCSSLLVMYQRSPEKCE